MLRDSKQSVFQTALALAGLLTLFALQNAGAAPMGNVSIPGHVRPIPANANYIGPLADTVRIDLSIALPVRNQAALEALIDRLYNPKDSLFGQYLTPEAFTEGYGPTQADYDAVKNYVQSHGLTITHESSNRLLINVSGTAGAIRSAFNVQLNQFKSASGREFHSIDTEPTVPADIAPTVQAILGLDNSNLPAPQIHHALAANSAHAATLTGPYNTFGPADIVTAYDLPSTLKGSGQVVAVVELYGGYLTSDISGYTSYFSSYFGSGYTPPIINISVDGYDTTTFDSNADETTTDICNVLNIAPQVKHVLAFEGTDNIYDCLTAIATDTTDTGTGRVADIVNISYGGGEDLIGSANMTTENAAFEELAAQGQSVFVSSGDNGAFGDYYYTGQTNRIPLDPASQPFVTAAGGTTLFVDATTGAWIEEDVWNDSYNTGSPSDGISGGGISSYWPIPSYQSTYIPTTNTSGYSKTWRNVPDVALNADQDNSPFAFYFNGSWQLGIGGTSCAAPSWAALTALVNQERNSKLHPDIGFLNPSLYSLASGIKGLSDLHDIVNGNIGIPSVTGYNAVPGYDLTTGWGSFDGAGLISDLAAVGNLTPTTSSLVSSKNPSTFGSAVTFTATIKPSVPNGETVAFFDGQLWIGSGTTNGSVASITTSALLGGIQVITATYPGDLTYAGSVSNSLTQTTKPAATTTAIASWVNPSTFRTLVTFNATVTPSVPDNETVSFYDGVTLLGAGTTFGGSASFSTSALAVGSHNINAKYGGDPNYLPSASSSMKQSVVAAPTMIALSSMPNPSTYGTSLTLTATISPSVADVETVTFFDGARAIGTAQPSGGVATFSTASLAAGNHSITASYPGDTDYLKSTSNKLTQTVLIARPIITLLSSLNASTYGAPIAFVALSNPALPNGGAFIFYDGATSKAPIGTAVASNGVAIFVTSALTAGKHTIWADYVGDPNHAYSWSNGLPLTVVICHPTTALSSSLNPSIFGASVTFNAVVDPTVPNGERVNFYDGAKSKALIGIGKTSGGVATFATSALSAGSHTIWADYVGDANYAYSWSKSLAQTVNVCRPTTSLVSSLNPSKHGAPVSFTATLSVSVPNGETVKFYDGATSKALIGTCKTSGGMATFTTPALASGNHTIWADYVGDANHMYSWSNGLVQTVR